MTKRKATTGKAVTSAIVTIDGSGEDGQARFRRLAEECGIVVRPADWHEFVLMVQRAEDLGLSQDRAVTAFVAARAAIAGTVVGKQRAAGYLDDRRRAFAAARHAVLVPEG